MGNGGKKILKKQIIMLGIVVMLICVGLSGCEDTTETGDIIGTWKYETLIGDERTWTFYENGTLKWDSENDDPQEQLMKLWVNYTIDDNKLCTEISHYTNDTICWDYRFSNDGQRLALSARGGTLIFSKIQ